MAAARNLYLVFGLTAITNETTGDRPMKFCTEIDHKCA
jgi:hypothetical protein